MQFARSELVGPRRYRLSHLLRGQFGTDAAMAEMAPAESVLVILDDHLQPLQAGDGDSVSLRYGIAGVAEDSYSWREKGDTNLCGDTVLGSRAWQIAHAGRACGRLACELDKAHAYRR